jgi:WD40 repeat protein
VSGEAALHLVGTAGLTERPPEVRTIVLAGEPYEVDFGPDATVAAGLADGSVVVVDAATATVRAVIDGGTGGELRPATVDYAPDGRLAVGTVDGVRVYADPDAPPVAVVGGTGDGADGVVAFSGDGARVLTGGRQEGALRSVADPARDLMVWDLATGAPVWSQAVPEICGGVAIVDDAVLCASGTGRIVAFDGLTGRALGPRYDLHHGGGRDVVVDAGDNTLLAVAASSPVVGRWSLDGRSPIAPIIGGPGFHPLNFSPDGQLLLLEATDGPTGTFGAGPIELWDAAEADRVARLPLLAAVFTGDGQIAGISDELAPVLHDPGSGAEAPLGPVHSLLITAVSLGARSRFAVAYDDGVVEQFDLTTGGPVGAPIDVGTGADSVAYGRDGSILAVAHDEVVELFDSDTGADAGGPLDGHTVAATPDGRVMVTSTVAGDVTIHDPETFERRGDRIIGPSADVNNIVVTDDGATLLVASWDLTVRVIDVASRQTLGDPMAMTVALGSLHLGATLAPDGRALAVAGPAGVRLWDLDPARWQAVACLLAGRNLTVEEWERHLPAGEPYHATCSQWASG